MIGMCMIAGILCIFNTVRFFCFDSTSILYITGHIKCLSSQYTTHSVMVSYICSFN